MALRARAPVAPLHDAPLCDTARRSAPAQDGGPGRAGKCRAAAFDQPGPARLAKRDVGGALPLFYRLRQPSSRPRIDRSTPGKPGVLGSV